ncbi:MAG: type 4a pilus biogenesis protein PilO [bacterium]|nr:type 4a pilus biogenesis protein PilO [bacterium]
MNLRDILNKLKTLKLTKEQQTLLLLVAIVFIGVGYAFLNYIYKPKLKEVNAKKQELIQLNSKIKDMQRRAMELEKLEAELSALTYALEEVNKRLPPKPDYGEVFRTISKIAKKYNISMTSFNPGKPEPVSGAPYSRIRNSVSVIGGLHTFMQFLSDVCSQERIMTISIASIQQGPGATASTPDPSKSISSQLDIYTYLSQ